MKVSVAARRIERLEAWAAEQLDRPVLPIQADMRQAAEIQRMFGKIRRTWGCVDVLVNSAGLGHSAPLLSGKTKHWREMLEVNVLALCIGTREAVAAMMRQKCDGHVIHISSMPAHRVPNGSGVYSASKFAVRSLTEGLRQELRAQNSPIRVTSISPGFVETEFAEKFHQSAAAAKKTYSDYPVLTSDDIAQAVEYVLRQPKHVQIHDVLLRATQQEF